MQAMKCRKTGYPLTNLQLILFSCPAIPLAVMLVPLTAFIPIFYSKYAGLSLTAIGGTLMLVRLLDVVTDPAIALFSDNSRFKIGRRIPWMVMGTPILLGGLYFLLNPMVSGSVIYLFVSATVVYLGWTMIQIPYYAWGTDLVRDYKTRTRLSSFREGSMIIGIAVAALVPVYTSRSGHDLDHYTMGLLFIIVALLLIPAVGLVSVYVKDTPLKNRDKLEKINLRLLNCFEKPFLRLLMAFLSIGMGKGVAVSVTAYFVTYGLGMPEVIGPTLFLPYICIILSIPVWVKVAGVIGRHRAVTVSLVLASLILVIGVWPLEHGDGWLFVGVECFVGLAAGAFAIFPTAIVADVSDYHTLKTGRQQEALHFSVWSMVQKAVQAVAVGLTLPLIAYMGFDPNISGESEQSLFILKSVFVGLPIAFYLIGASLLWNFPITEIRHSIIRRRLEKTEFYISNKIGQEK